MAQFYNIIIKELLLNELTGLLLFLGFVCFIFMCEILWVIKFFYKKIKLQGVYENEHKSLSSILVHIIFFVIVSCLAYAYFLEPHWLKVDRISIFTDKLKNSSFRIVQISDLHCDKKNINESNIVKIINSVNADIVVFTGDAINNMEGLPRFKNTLLKLNVYRKYAVRGNVDVKYWPNVDLFGGTGFKVLDGEGIFLTKNKESIFICGLDYTYRPINPRLFENIKLDYFSIFLYHTPVLVRYAAPLIDLYLCGHTHGGQVALPFYGAIITFSKYGKKYEAGKYQVGNTLLYVNRGLGMVGLGAPKLRFFSRPQIAIFDIKPKLKAK